MKSFFPHYSLVLYLNTVSASQPSNSQHDLKTAIELTIESVITEQKKLKFSRILNYTAVANARMCDLPDLVLIDHFMFL